MNIDTTRALARPRHVFDLPAVTVWTLAAAGTAALAIAHVLDDAVARREARASERAQRPRARLGPKRTTHAEFGATDAWRLR